MGTYSGDLVALFATSSLLYLFSSRAHRIGLLDKPSGHKIHQAEIPTVGGIAIFCGFLLALFSTGISDTYLVSFVLPSLLLVCVGILDDIFIISHKPRFIVQIMAALLMTLAGEVVIDQLGELLIPGEMMNLGMMAIPFTVVCVVGIVNAFNMSDGIDGLAGSLTLVALLGLGTVAYIGGKFSMVASLSFLIFSLITD